MGRRIPSAIGSASARAAAAKTLRLIINQRPSKIGGERKDLSFVEMEG